MTMRTDIGDTTHAVDVKHDEVGSAGGGHGGRRMNFEFGAGSGKSLADKGANLALDQVDHHTAQTLVGVVNVFGDLDAAMLADGQDAVVIQERFAARLLVRLDYILEKHPVLDLCRDWALEARMGNGHFPFHSREDADIDLIILRRIVGPGSRCHEQYDAASGRNTAKQTSCVMPLWLHEYPR